MPSKDLTLQNQLGLHARAAMKFVETASRYACSVNVKVNERTVDGKDMLKMLSLGLPCGTDLTVSCNGDDDQTCLDALVQLVNDKFGEE